MKQRFGILATAWITMVGAPPAASAPLQIATLERDTPVDFSREIVPFLKRNCFACHNEKKAKADLNLESPQAMMKGGDLGPALVPGKPQESLVFTYAAHLEDDPMPPASNKSKAVNLTADQLALFRLWIEQGAKGTSAAVLAGPEKWASLADTKTIYSVAISRDARFAACGRGNRIHVYDLRRESLVADLIDPAASIGTAHRDQVHSLAFNRYGVLASGGYRSVKLWERRVTRTLPVGHGLPDSATALATSPDGTVVAAGDGAGNLIIQPLGKAEVAAPQKRHTAAIRGIAFAPDGQTVYSGSEDKTMARSSVADPKSAQVVTLASEILAIAVLDRGKTLAIGGIDGTIRLLPASRFDQPADAGPEGPLQVELKGHTSRILTLAASGPEGTQLISASEDGTVRIWDLSGKQLRQIAHGSPIVAMSAHQAANRIATAGQDGVVGIWDTTTGKKLGELKGDLDFDQKRGERIRKRDVAKRVAELRKKQLAESEKKWNELREKSKTEAGKIAAAVKDLEAKDAAVQPKRRDADEVHRAIAALEAAQDHGAAGKAKERAKKIDAELKKLEDELTKAERAEEAARRNRELSVRDAAQAGERFLASQANATEAEAALAAAEELVKTMEAEAAAVGPGALKCLSFSPDGTVIAVGAEKIGVRTWSAVTFQPLDVLQRERVPTTLRHLPGGALLASFADKDLAIWPASANWEMTRQIGDGSSPAPFPGRVLALAFHPRGHILATGCGIPSRSGQIKLWRLRDGFAEGAIDKAHEDTITGLAFSPDGAQLASGSTDRFVKVHQGDSGKLLDQFEGHTGHVLDVAWSADGQTIASAGADHVAKLWSAEEGSQKKTEGGFKKELSAIAFLGTGDGLLMAGGDKIVKAAGQNLGGVGGIIYDATASPDGAIIAAGGEAGILRIWRASDRKLLHSFATPPSEPTETAAK